MIDTIRETSRVGSCELLQQHALDQTSISVKLNLDLHEYSVTRKLGELDPDQLRTNVLPPLLDLTGKPTYHAATISTELLEGVSTLIWNSAQAGIPLVYIYRLMRPDPSILWDTEINRFNEQVTFGNTKKIVLVRSFMSYPGSEEQVMEREHTCYRKMRVGEDDTWKGMSEAVTPGIIHYADIRTDKFTFLLEVMENGLSKVGFVVDSNYSKLSQIYQYFRELINLEKGTHENMLIPSE